jgi:D-lactate dehydrogenase
MPKDMTATEIEALILRVLTAPERIEAIARDSGIDLEQLSQWVKAYRDAGAERLRAMQAREGRLNVAMFSTQAYDHDDFKRALADSDSLHFGYFRERLTLKTVDMAQGFGAVCAFVNDQLDADVLEALARRGVHTIALRCAGFNNLDLAAARRLGLTVTRVPGYSPEAPAEHAMALILALNRQLIRSHRRVAEGNFALHGLLGFNLRGTTVGVIGTGRIGTAFARILAGFGCRILAYDPEPNEECRDLGVRYVELDALLRQSLVVSLHCPLNASTHYLIDADAIDRMPRGVMLINTGRGALIDTQAVIRGLKTGQIGYLGLDVYEQEENLFFEDRSFEIITDDIFQRLLTFPNVMITGHQGFFTRQALDAIAESVVANLHAIAADRPPPDAILR